MTTRAAAATALDAELLSTTGVPLADAAESPTRTLRTRLRKASTASGSADKENAATQPPRTAAPASTSAGVAAATITQAAPARTRAKTTTAATRGRATRSRAKSKKVYCLCKGPDDGSPMVQCGLCDDWFHFRCIDLDEEDASEIKVYVCPQCSEQTGRRTVMDYDGPEALEAVDASAPSGKELKVEEKEAQEQKQSMATVAEAEASSDGGGDGGSADEYVEEEKSAKSKAAGKRPTRRLSVSSESEQEGAAAPTSRLRRASKVSRAYVQVPPRSASATRAPGSASQQLKRRPSGASGSPHAPPPPSKRPRSESTTPGEDATRKYCIGKLADVLVPVFKRHPVVEGGVEKAPEELDEEETAFVEERARAYAAELERCVFETYAEPDKFGKASAAGKYKERFRMLTFNLPHANRVPLHKRITSGTLSPRELSSMSSNDLASEEEQQSIRQAEQESLAHSILQRAVLPRAKITHKGLQDIEVDDPGVGSSVDLARDVGLPPLLPSTRPPVRAASGSVPPESPVVHTPVSATWGAPPPLPLDGMASEHHQHHHHHHPGSGSGGMSAHPLYSPAEPDFSQSHVEGELNLDDLIHMDDELADAAAGPSGTTPTASQTQSTPEGSPPATVPGLVSAPTLTGISPFAASMPDMPPRASFDLNALWTAPKAEEPAARPLTPSPQPDASQAGGPDGDGDVQMDGGPGSVEGMEDVAEPQDQDFDMFLGKDEDEKPAPVAQTPQEVFDALPQVWSGVLNMPLDSTIPQETHVLARQIGGRPLEQSSALWRTLFPAETLRIEGRVPVQNTAQYLVTSRMNALKEYIAVAFTPSSDADHNGFKLLGEFLINKDRHGLIFPWGQRGKDWGKELYVIPLLASHPIPEYVELLDHLRLPRERSTDCMVGIWVLNRGRLAPPPPQISQQPPPVQLPFSLPLSLPSLSGITPLHNTQPMFLPHAPSPAIPGLASLSAAISSAIPAPPLPTLKSIEPATLAAEVASLTPEQISLMMEALRKTVNLAPPPPAPAPAPGPQPGPSHFPPYPQQPINQPWPQSIPGFLPSSSPGNSSAPPPNSLGPSPPSFNPGPYHPRQEQYGDPPPGAPYGRGGQSERGPRAPRARARGGRGRGNDDFRRSSDSGWSRRGRGRGGSSGVGSGSPERFSRRGEAPSYWN